MSDQLLDQVVRKKFESAPSPVNQFSIAASMTDWRLMYPLLWQGYRVLPWDSESLEIHVPLLGYMKMAMFGGPRPITDGLLKIKLDQAGQVVDTQRAKVRQPFPHRDFSNAPVLDEFQSVDPWPESSFQAAVYPVFMIQLEKPIQTTRWIETSEYSNRFIYINYTKYGNEQLSFADRVVITTNPQIEFKVFGEQYTDAQTHFFSNAYIVQDSDFKARSGEMKNKNDPPFDFVPKFVTSYEAFIVLAPHDGVEIQLEIANEEATQ